MTPQEQAAQEFMAYKGYPGIAPAECIQRARFTWLFVYELPEGDLELLVKWVDEARFWSVTVKDFALVE